jgi:hypothetical protein
MKKKRNIHELKELFLDLNMNMLIDLHDNLVNENADKGLLNTSTSNKFINIIMDNVILNNTQYATYNYQTKYDTDEMTSSSDEENAKEVLKKS